MNGGGGVWTLLKEGHFLEATQQPENVGEEVEAGLPNIEGTFDSVVRAHDSGQTGALSSSSNYNYEYHGFNKWNDPCSILKIDASLSNSIYGSSETVQPKSIRCFIWRRVS